MSVVAIIVTYNPELSRFKYVLNQASKQANHVIIVDNGSKTKDILKKLCNETNNCDFVEISFNSGVAHALRVGVNYASKCKPDWLLFLDDDTVLMSNAVGRALGLISNLPEFVLDRVGAVLMGSVDGDCGIGEVRYGIFSGTLIRADIAVRVCCRDGFFLDQADYDMYSRIRRHGYFTFSIDCRLVDHRLGMKRWVPIISNIFHRSVDYEPPWRYYYIVRNSTRLLLEGRMDFTFYMRQLINWGIRILLADGPWKLIKPLGLGIIHAILNELGYVESKAIT
jgi:rhamnosyltransferase